MLSAITFSWHLAILLWKLGEADGRATTLMIVIGMATVALLRQNRDPSEADIAAALNHLCRCGIYPRLIDAVRQAAAAARGDATLAPPPRPGIDRAEAARETPALTPPTK